MRAAIVNVSHCMTRDVVPCHPSDSLARASQIFWDRDCGCIPVVDEHHMVVGMVTDRDVAMATYTQGRPPGEILVDWVMAREARCCQEDDLIEDALRSMREAQVRRLPVIDPGGRLIGILSLADVMRTLSQDPRARQRYGADVLAVMSAVTRQRATPPAIVEEPLVAQTVEEPALV